MFYTLSSYNHKCIISKISLHICDIFLYCLLLEKGGRHRRKYGGSTGWMLSHDKGRDVWSLEHEHYPDQTLTMEDKDFLPVGLHSWVAANDNCNLGQTDRQVCHSGIQVDTNHLSIKSVSKTTSNLFQSASVQLQLSACLSTQFTCHTGKCVSMESRCDNIEVGSAFKIKSSCLVCNIIGL